MSRWDLRSYAPVGIVIGVLTGASMSIIHDPMRGLALIGFATMLYFGVALVVDELAEAANR